MLLRRIRAVLMSALIWGSLAALLMSVASAIMLLIQPQFRSNHGFWNDVFVGIPGIFWYVAAIAGSTALIVSIAERNSSVDTLSSERFRLWGGIAGALVGLAASAFGASESTPPSHNLLEPLAVGVFLGACIGAKSASQMLRVARRARPELPT